MQPAKPTRADWLRLIALSVIWGASFLNVHLALESFGPLTVAALRITLAAIALYILMRMFGLHLPRNIKIWLHILGMAAFSNAVPFALLGFGQRFVASGFAGITMAAVPLFTLVLAHRFLPNEPMTRWKLAGFSLGFVGILTLIGPAAFEAEGTPMETVARLACFAAALSYAVGSIFTRRCPPVPMIALSAAALIAAAGMIIPLALLVEGVPSFTSAKPTALLAVLYLGLFPTALATLLLVQVIQSAGPTFLTQSNYQVPVWSVIFGATLLGERLPPAFLIALALILAGLALSHAPAWRRRP